ncbi:MAG: hypothetical protein K0R24_2018 [Gammaproteobacteria bacterium]|jgi:hypothetical protein|nr:hypothetical protein [Gammaproteobacteria bacterium]
MNHTGNDTIRPYTTSLLRITNSYTLALAIFMSHTNDHKSIVKLGK